MVSKLERPLLGILLRFQLERIIGRKNIFVHTRYNGGDTVFQHDGLFVRTEEEQRAALQSVSR